MGLFLIVVIICFFSVVVAFDKLLIHMSRYDPCTNSCHDDMEGNGVICLAVDILPTEFSKEVGSFIE